MNDNRIHLINISSGLKDALHNAGFTIDSILSYGPANLAEKLGIDEYVGQIIFNETKKLRINF
ncbi:MAG: hypothetical protein ACPKQO_05975 [Nitrososphaeraceae archaeon]